MLWARSQIGHIGLNPVFCNITTICEEVAELFRDIAQQKNIFLNVFHSDNAYAYADKNMIETVIRNLISNALKYTEKDGIIDVYSTSRNDFIIITISDDGVGLSDSDEKLLFHLDSLSNTKKGTDNESGTGFGLIICKEFVERNGGEIWLEKKMEKGTEFKFSIPKYNGQ